MSYLLTHPWFRNGTFLSEEAGLHAPRPIEERRQRELCDAAGLTHVSVSDRFGTFGGFPVDVPVAVMIQPMRERERAGRMARVYAYPGGSTPPVYRNPLRWWEVGIDEYSGLTPFSEMGNA